MTTAKPEIHRTPKQWEPYPELPREPKHMLQSPAVNHLREILQNVLTPGWDYPYHPTILIGSEIPIYYGAADPATGGPPPHVIPDCLVAFDVDTGAIWQRVGYDPLQNGKPPDFVMEVASRTTHRNDTLRKRAVYRQLEIPEYWRFDPEGGRYYGRAIIGERLVNGQYERFPLVQYDGGAVGSTSPLLNSTSDGGKGVSLFTTRRPERNTPIRGRKSRACWKRTGSCAEQAGMRNGPFRKRPATDGG